MQLYKDNYIISDENSICEVAVYSVIGDRGEQQDSAGYEMKSNSAIVTVCDGMGGFEGGKLASSLAVEKLLKIYSENYLCENTHTMLIDAVGILDKTVRDLKNELGEWLKAGSTLASVVINEQGLFWLSVGDSRIYIVRDNNLYQVTVDHIYSLKLKKDLAAGTISKDEYNEKIANGEALISFLGIGGLPMCDCNETAFKTLSGDRIIIMSDGLYKLVPDGEVCAILSNFSNMPDALRALDSKAKHYAKSKKILRDNMTLALINIK